MSTVDLKDPAMPATKVAEALGVPLSTVYDLCARRLIEYERPSPGRIRIRQSALENYIRSVRVPARG